MLPPGCESARPDGIIDRRFAEPNGFAGMAGVHCATAMSPPPVRQPDLPPARIGAEGRIPRWMPPGNTAAWQCVGCEDGAKAAGREATCPARRWVREHTAQLRRSIHV